MPIRAAARGARSALLALSVPALLAPAPAALALEPGPEPRSGPAALVAGFASLPWGADRERVIATKGEPTATARPQPDVEALAYDGRLLGREVTTTLVVAESRGMIKGLYTFPTKGGDDCLRWYAYLVELVKARHPSAEVIFEERVNTGARGFCEAARRGEAGALTSLRDPRGTSVHVAVPPGASAVRVAYETAAFERLVERRRAPSASAPGGGTPVSRAAAPRAPASGSR